MPWHVLVCHTSLVDHLITFAAPLCKFILIAGDTDNFLVTWYKALIADWLFADHAAETLLMPLFAFVLKFLHPSSEWVMAAITSGCKQVVMAISTVDLFILWSKGLIN